jgi:SAM-dependent methyltransferase
MPDDTSETWHYGLMARWWAEFNEPEPEEVAYLRTAIQRFGQPALDLGCGTGRLLTPLLAEGLDVDGVDVSADMLGHARAAAAAIGASPLLEAQPMHRLDLPRRYRTIFMIGSFELAGDRAQGRETLRRAYVHLEPGGALIVNHELPYHSPEDRWALWLPGMRGELPRPWRTIGRRRTADGDEIELRSRLIEFDPLRQIEILESHLQLSRAGEVKSEERWRLRQDVYFPQEILELIRQAGFHEIDMESSYAGRPAVPDDGTVTFVARKVTSEAAIGSGSPA